MIYYIVAIDPTTRNEWVVSTHESVVSATKACDNLRKNTTDYEYRIDTAESNEEIKTPEPRTLPGDDHHGYLSTDESMFLPSNNPPLNNRQPFTARELFPSTLKGVMVSDCIECGAYVRIPKHRLHAEWHNKIADL